MMSTIRLIIYFVCYLQVQCQYDVLIPNNGLSTSLALLEDLLSLNGQSNLTSLSSPQLDFSALSSFPILMPPSFPIKLGPQPMLFQPDYGQDDGDLLATDTGLSNQRVSSTADRRDDKSTDLLTSINVTPKKTAMINDNFNSVILKSSLASADDNDKKVGNNNSDEDEDDGDSDDEDDIIDSKVNDLSVGTREMFSTILRLIKQEMDSSAGNTSKLDGDPFEREKLTWLAFSKVLGRLMDSLGGEIMSYAMEVIPNLNISSPCITTLHESLDAMKKQKSWSLKMIDATGRPFATGLMDGTITDFGSFDQCISLVIPLEIGSSGQITRFLAKDSQGQEKVKPNLVRGQYCMVQYNTYLPPRPAHLNLQTRIFNFTNTPLEGTFLEEISELIHVCYERVGRVGICTPSTCTKDDIEQLIDYTLRDLHLHANVSHCEVETGFELNSFQLFVLGVFSILVLLTLIGTVLDMIDTYSYPPLPGFAEPTKEPHESFLKKVLINFSIPNNLTALFDTRTKPGSLDAINGIRVISMSWIVYTHTYLIPIKETFAFARSYILSVESFLFQFILNGWVLVDTFFCIGAMLAVYSHLGSIHRTGRYNLIEMITSRFVRFSPSVWFTLALLFLLPSLGTGPLWSEYFNNQIDKCENYWWATVLFFNNWFPEAKICMLHTWYISADMQLYIVSLLFLIPLYKFGSKALYLPYGLTFISMIAVFLATYLRQAAPTVIYNTPSEVISDGEALSIYTPTYIHLGPYCVGIIAGYLVYTKRNLRLPLPVCLTLWIASTSGLLTILFYTYTWNIGNEWTPLSSASYATLHRTCWSICIAWITFACVTGNGGPVNSLLSWKGFVPLARLSFMIYLMHFPILWWRYAYLRERLPFGHYTMLCEFIVNFTLSMFAALLAHLIVEAPAARLYKMFIQKRFNWATIKLAKRRCDKSPNPDSLVTFRS